MSVYGGLFSHNKHEDILENFVPLIEETSFGDITCLAFREMLNYSNLLSESASETDKLVYEAKMELLQEVSFSQIKENIIKIIKKMIQFVKECIQKLKDIFQDKKKSWYKKRCEELERQLKEKDIEINLVNAAADSYKSQASNYQSQAKDNWNAAKSAVKQGSDKIKELEDELDEQKSSNSKLKSDLVASEARISAIVNNIRNNDYIYFDFWDYVKKGFDPQRVVRSGEFDTIFKSYFDRDNKVRERLENWLKEMNQYFEIYNTDIFGDINFKYGGYSHSEVHQRIRENLKKKPRITNIDKLMDQLNWLAEGRSVSAANEIMVQYQKLLSQLELVITKNFGYNKKINPDTLEYDNKDNPNKDIIDVVKQYMQMLDNTVRFTAVLSQYAGKATGAAYSAINTLSIALGLDVVKSN